VQWCSGIWNRSQQFPFVFEESFSNNAEANRWRVPDLAVVDWLTAESEDDTVVMDKRKLEIHRRMGESPLRISSAKLRLELNHDSLLEDLFQCLSASEWANVGELLVAASITDPRMIEEINRFASRYGIGVISFGLDADILDDMPEPAVIENLGEREFESHQEIFLGAPHSPSHQSERLDVTRLATRHS
jgi:hypothetical protein